MAVVLVLIIVSSVAALAYVQVRLGEVERVEAAGRTASRGGLTILLVGSDSRAGLAPGQESFGTAEQVSGQRSDAIMLLRIRPARGGAAVLSIPRDLWVPIAGTGQSGRINGAYGGGPDRLVQTITPALGIPIDHYIEVNFDGFRAVVEAIGGLNMYFPAPARDALAELDVPTAGCVSLTGAQGLAYVRSRQYQSYEDGRWRTDPTGDHGRIERQQDFMRRMFRKAAARGLRNPLVANRLLGVLVQNVKLDRDLGVLDLTRLGWQLRSLGSGSGDSVEMMTLPTVGTRIAGASVLRPEEPDASETIGRFLDPPPQAAGDVNPSEVRVRVLNGSGRPGEAGRAAAALQQAGLQVTETGDASARPGNTLVGYADGAQAKAQLVAGYVGGPVELRAEPQLGGADVLLTTGAAFTGIRVPGEAPPAAPATPAAPECAP